jgi:hypothetical protein
MLKLGEKMSKICEKCQSFAKKTSNLVEIFTNLRQLGICHFTEETNYCVSFMKFGGVKSMILKVADISSTYYAQTLHGLLGIRTRSLWVRSQER